jgi:hypothetical protein
VVKTDSIVDSRQLEPKVDLEGQVEGTIHELLLREHPGFEEVAAEPEPTNPTERIGILGGDAGGAMQK